MSQCMLGMMIVHEISVESSDMEVEMVKVVIDIQGEDNKDCNRGQLDPDHDLGIRTLLPGVLQSSQVFLFHFHQNGLF